jgi:predicted dehydrogenase
MWIIWAKHGIIYKYRGQRMSTSGTNPIRTAIVGCGEHSHVHGEAASKLQEIRITACCDVIEDRACSWAKKYGCERYYTNITEAGG